MYQRRAERSLERRVQRSRYRRRVADRPTITITMDDAVVLSALLRKVVTNGVSDQARALLETRIEWLEARVAEPCA